MTDFGIAYLRDATGHSSTHVTASWLHAPPETFDNARDERSDLYSLASTLYTLVAGHAPFWRPDDESLSPLIVRVLNDPPPELSAGLAPTSLSHLIIRSLAKEPSERPQTMVELSAALQQLKAEPEQQTTPAKTQVARPIQASYPSPGLRAETPPAQQAQPGPAAQRFVSGAPTQPAGWYQAEGDPPNTQRYWDGALWLGDPQPVAATPNRQNAQQFRATPMPAPGQGPGGRSVGTPPFVPAQAPGGGGSFTSASYGRRAIAYLIDLGIFLIAYLIVISATAAGDDISTEFGTGVATVGVFGLLVLAIWNYCLRQGKTGQTIGKQLLSIKLVSDTTGLAPGRARAFIRNTIAFLISFSTCSLGGLLNMLWPLWDSEQKRFTDKWLHLSVVDA